MKGINVASDREEEHTSKAPFYWRLVAMHQLCHWMFKAGFPPPLRTASYRHKGYNVSKLMHVSDLILMGSLMTAGHLVWLSWHGMQLRWLSGVRRNERERTLGSRRGVGWFHFQLEGQYLTSFLNKSNKQKTRKLAGEASQKPEGRARHLTSW